MALDSVNQFPPCNVNGLDTHFENLYEFLTNDNSPVFDITNIIETSTD